MLCALVGVLIKWCDGVHQYQVEELTDVAVTTNVLSARPISAVDSVTFPLPSVRSSLQ